MIFVQLGDETKKVKEIEDASDVKIGEVTIANLENKTKRTLKLEQNMSFRDISIYFAKYHKFEISHSLIYKIWIEIEITGNKSNEY